MILLERERANGFRRHMEILHERCTDTIHFSDLRMSQMWIEDLAWYKASRVQWDTPLMMLEWALGWANSVPPPPLALLREARALLVAAAEDWAISFQLCRAITSKFMVLHKQEGPHWLDETIRIAKSEQLRLDAVLRESWPGSASQEQEAKALEQMRAGHTVGLEETFALVSGCSEEEWAQRVEAHRKARRR